MDHELKCWVHWFEALWDGRKTCEVRQDDNAKAFKVGDKLLLCEWNPTSEVYTGRRIEAVVTHITCLDNVPRLEVAPGWVVLSLRISWRETVQ